MTGPRTPGAKAVKAGTLDEVPAFTLLLQGRAAAGRLVGSLVNS